MHRLILFVLILVNSLAAQDKKVALVTGASRGIGLATAKLLAEKDYCVYAGVRNLIHAEHKNIQFIQLDVTDDLSVQKAIGTILDKESRLDIVINNAGYALAGPLECLSLSEIQDQINVNFLGPIRVCQAVLPQMRKQKTGHIINISSDQGTYGLPYGSLYTSSKAALESLSEALSIEVSPWNIKVSIVEPGMVATNFSICLGSRALDGNPYKKIFDKLSNSIKENLQKIAKPRRKLQNFSVPSSPILSLVSVIKQVKL